MNLIFENYNIKKRICHKIRRLKCREHIQVDSYSNSRSNKYSERILNAMHISSEDQRNPEIPNLTIPLYKDVKVLNLNQVQFFYFQGQEQVWNRQS